MSKDSFHKFYSEIVIKDKGLLDKLQNTADVNCFMEIAEPLAKDGGYEFSADDVAAIVEGRGELTDEQADQVHGGRALAGFQLRAARLLRAEGEQNPGGGCSWGSTSGDCCN